MKTLFLILSIALVSSIAYATPAQVLIIRHAEKPDQGNDLSPAGYERAQAYVRYFETNPAVTHFGTPVAIYVMAPDANDQSNRAIETVTPLAQALHLTIHTNYGKNNTQPMVREILTSPAYNGKMVLICWEHHVIPTIAQQFGVSNAPMSWPGSIFNNVWEINFSGSQISGFAIFPANILPGDG